MIGGMEWKKEELLNSQIIYLSERDQTLLFEFIRGSVGCSAFCELVLHLSRENSVGQVDLVALIEHIGLFEAEGFMLFLHLCITTKFSDDIISRDLFSIIQSQYS